MPPTGDLALNPGMCPRLGIEQVALWFAGQHSIHWATPARASLTLLCFPERKQKINFPCAGVFPIPGDKRHSYHQTWGIQGQETCSGKFVTSLICYLKQKHLCFVQSSQIIISLSTKYKNCLLGLLLWTSYFSPTYKIKFDCFSPVVLSMSISF